MQIAFALYDYYPFGVCRKTAWRPPVRCATRGMRCGLSPAAGRAKSPKAYDYTSWAKRAGATRPAMTTFFKSHAAERTKHSLDGLVAFNRVPGADIYFAADPGRGLKEADKAYAETKSYPHIWPDGIVKAI